MFYGNALTSHFPEAWKSSRFRFPSLGKSLPRSLRETPPLECGSLLPPSAAQLAVRPQLNRNCTLAPKLASSKRVPLRLLQSAAVPPWRDRVKGASKLAHSTVSHSASVGWLSEPAHPAIHATTNHAPRPPQNNPGQKGNSLALMSAASTANRFPLSNAWKTSSVRRRESISCEQTSESVLMPVMAVCDRRPQKRSLPQSSTRESSIVHGRACAR